MPRPWRSAVVAVVVAVVLVVVVVVAVASVAVAVVVAVVGAEVGTNGPRVSTAFVIFSPSVWSSSRQLAL